MVHSLDSSSAEAPATQLAFALLRSSFFEEEKSKRLVK
jgi:hypothetical protein